MAPVSQTPDSGDDTSSTSHAIIAAVLGVVWLTLILHVRMIIGLWRFVQALHSWLRFQNSGRREDLDSAIAFQQAALDHLGHFPSWYSAHLPLPDILSFLLRARYERWGKAEDLERAIMAGRASLHVRLQTRAARSRGMRNLASSLRTRFNHDGRIDDLEEAISLERAALELLPEGHPDRSVVMSDLTLSLRTRFNHGGRIDDLEQAISLQRTVLELRPESHPYRSLTLAGLAVSLRMRFNHGGRIDDLEQAISLQRAALEPCPEGHPGRSWTLVGLATSLWTRFNYGGRIDDLEQAISLQRAVLELCLEGHPGGPTTLHDLATSLWTRFNHSGRVDDLEEAISLLRAVLELRPEGHPERSSTLARLALGLQTRFNHGGRVDDLEQAISLLRAALELRPEGDPERSSTLARLALCLQTRFNRSGRMADLEQAISLHLAALELCPESHPDRSSTLSNLANSLRTRFNHGGRVDDLKQAISLQRAALQLCPEGHPERSLTLANLATSIWTRFNHGGRIDDLEQAISLQRAALALCPEGHPARSVNLSNVAEYLYSRFQKELCANDLEESVRCLSRAASHPFSSPLDRLRCAHRWSTIARSHNHDTLLEAHRTLTSLLQRALTIRPSLSEQHEFLRNYQTFAPSAASDAIDRGEFSLAVEFLEQGRALLWSQLRGFRTPLEQLSQVDGALAERFRKCSRRLEALLTWSESRTTGASSSTLDLSGLSAYEGQRLVDHMLARIRRLSEEQEVIIADIRGVPGFEDFLKTSSFKTIQSAAAEGPVIVLNHSEHRCDVLIVLARDVDPCVCVPLDSEFYQDAIDLHEELTWIRKYPGVDSSEYDRELRRVMKVLWDRVVSKVVQKLKELGINEGSRIWWCPTSVLSAFPFHAAGPYEGADGRDRYLLDDYISSYTPTLSSLINARSSGSRNAREKMLFVGVGDKKLTSAKKERDAIIRIRRFKELLDDAATPDAVLQQLKGVQWAHFACHGVLAKEPFNSSLKLSGGELTLLDIARANLPRAEFAFLSACHTAEQEPDSALDESLHLAAGMQFCGFRSVVGTMWQLLDHDSPSLSSTVYKYMMCELEEGEIRFKRAAAAVRLAAVNLRENGDMDPKTGKLMTERWVNLVHIGA